MSHNVPQTSHNALPGAQGSRHSLDQRTLHKLVQRKTGPCTLHNWQEELRHKAENTCLHYSDLGLMCHLVIWLLELYLYYKCQYCLCRAC